MTLDTWTLESKFRSAAGTRRLDEDDLTDHGEVRLSEPELLRSVAAHPDPESPDSVAAVPPEVQRCRNNSGSK